MFDAYFKIGVLAMLLLTNAKTHFSQSERVMAYANLLRISS
jgi:hypothetical protein